MKGREIGGSYKGHEVEPLRAGRHRNLQVDS